MRRILLRAAFALALLAGPAMAQTAPVPQPLGDRGQPDAAELEMRALLRGEPIHGRISIPDAKAANLIQPEGREWRAFHNRTLAWVGGIAVLGMLGLLALFFLVRGRIRLGEGWSGRTLLRFNLLERANHWMVASCFIILALSGLNLTFGRHLLLPLTGPEAFTAISAAGKLAHNFLAFPFTLGLVLMLLLWVRDNIPDRTDVTWVKAGGGFLSGHHPKAGRFNAGQKMVFWITVLGGGLVAASGYVLIFPFTVVDIAGQQLAHIVHSLLAVLMIAAMLAHIYIGSLGMEGAFAAMGSGRVDYNWAKEHHALWVEEELARARQQVVPPPGAKAAGAD
ncbi:formate dehydrogenase subunit gamma [Belnapia rosea]|uniref:Formate dehydrogenase gamma subunit n=1 Tax=Belnapia rosea TaxID=938405 RepID=A0A1G6XCC0_9PROT|nr:formate dehydrogenase subunit gamma [Belnapia rosea]SDB70245.1 formate dehydrogenase subunit gamma [Belnapia rosea]SDD75790.1 formate dehydrogenase gamma subunit [Belnapia rosea]